MPPSRVIAALYARTSTIGHGQDVGLQLDELRQAASLRGWEIAGEYVDEGASGASRSRPGLDRMLADAHAGRFNVLAVWKLDRLARSLAHMLQTLDELQECGVGFASLRDPGIDTTSSTGRLLLQMLGAFAEFERCLIVERVRAGVARAKAKGKHCGRPPRHVDLRGAKILLDQGKSLRDVAAMMHTPRSTLRRRLKEATCSEGNIQGAAYGAATGAQDEA